MIYPKESFEKLYGKKEDAEFPYQWQKDFDLYFRGWKEGFVYSNEIRELEKESRDLSDFQRGQ